MILKRIRVAAAVLMITAITFFFVDFAGLIPQRYLSFLPGIQLVPALLALNVVAVVAILACTLLFGRIYCSVICPLGIFQDIVIWTSKRIGKKNRFAYKPDNMKLRIAVLIAAVVAWTAGMTFLTALVEPYSAFGRIASNIIRPVYLALNNLLAFVFMAAENYTFYYMDLAVRSVLALLVSLLTVVIISGLAYMTGRTWCNTMCPVGTFLGFFSRHSLFKIKVDTEKCNGCGLCEKRCKASCIDSKNHKVDHSRCVDCFDCIENCHKNAISYSPSIGKVNKNSDFIGDNGTEKDKTTVNTTRTDNVRSEHVKVDATATNSAETDGADNIGCADAGEKNKGGMSRRQFLVSTLTTATAGSLAVSNSVAKAVAEKATGCRSYERTALTPPGSVGHEHLLQHCTSCHLCISKCPSHVLKPAFMEYGLGGMMQPTMSFEKGFCNFDCTECSDVCPNGAIKPLTVEEKHITQMGYVVFIKQNCIVYRDGTSCGACAEHCPTQAVSMVPYGDVTIPHINPDICVGCGGCEYACPAKPFKAIHVEGNKVQKKAKPFMETGPDVEKVDDFGF